MKDKFPPIDKENLTKVIEVPTIATFEKLPKFMLNKKRI